jgi:hypothetical protein
MTSISRQIGWSNESNLLYQILKQLTRLTSVVFGLKPKYKVYTALLTQSGEAGESYLYGPSNLVVGVTYTITFDPNLDCDFTNVGAPNNNIGTSFVATGTTPNSWGSLPGDTELQYFTGAPVVTVLENTIGNIWFTYVNAGVYLVNNSNGWDETKFWYGLGGLGNSGGFNANPGNPTIQYESNLLIVTYNNDYSQALNGQLINTPIEIRVYS